LRKPAPLFLVNPKENYGNYGPRTQGLVSAFQQKWNSFANKPWVLPTDGKVDSLTLKTLLTPGAAEPYATPGYFIFNKGKQFTHMLKALALIASRECACEFTKTNRNGDGAGLSLGLLHWAQKPARLWELMQYFHTQAPESLSAIFGDQPVLGGGQSNIDAVLAQLHLGGAALYSKQTPPPPGRKNGDSIDRNLEFAKPDQGRPDWFRCFSAMLANRMFQGLLLDFALLTLARMYDENSPGYPAGLPSIPGQGLLQWGGAKIKSELGVVFTLDLINQHGNNARRFYEKIVAATPGISEADLLVQLQTLAKNSWIKQKPANKSEKQKQTEQANSEADERRRAFYLSLGWYLPAAVFVPTPP
jgi:hypothetical protein